MEIDEDIREAKEAVRQRPRWPAAHLRLARALHLQGDVHAAIASYERATELNPSLESSIEDALASLHAKAARELTCAVMTAPGSGAVFGVALQPGTVTTGSLTTRVLASAHEDGAVRLWCSATGTLLQTLGGHVGAVSVVAWSRTGTMLASGSLDCTARVWHIPVNGQGNGHESKTCWQPLHSLAVLKGHTSRVSGIAFDPSCNNILATCSPDQSARIWALPQGEPLHRLTGHSALVSSIALSPSGDLLVTASGDAAFRVWEVHTGRNVADVAWDSGPVVLCGFVPSCPPAPPLLLTAHAQLARQEGRVLLWDVLDRDHGWVDGRLAAPAKAIDGLMGRPTAWDACTDGEGNVLVAVACSDGSGRVWDITDAPIALFGFEARSKGDTAAAMPPWRASSLKGAANCHNLVCFSPGGGLLAASGSANAVSIFDVDSGCEVCVLAGHAKSVRQLVWISEGEVVTASEDGTVRKWRVPLESTCNH